MAIRLGEFLVREGAVTSAQLEEALKNQVIFGGRLGTNLIEMGLLSENELARLLGKKLGVPFVDPEELTDIPPQVIQLLPRELVEKYRVIPLRVENRRLTLVMADPTELKAVDEISFRTGFIIRPVITPDVRVIVALEKYYQIERKMRYIQVSRHVNRTKKKTAVQADPAPASPSVSSAFSSGAFELAALALEDLQPAPLSPPHLEAPEELEEAEMVEEPGAEDILHSIEGVSRSLAEAEDREDIAEIIVSYLGQEFFRGALFLVRGDMALGWRGVVNRTPIEAFEQVQIPLDEPSVLKTVAESKSFYLGPLARTPFNSMILQELGGRVPETAMVVPLLMMGRVVGILYVDGAPGNQGDRLYDLQRLTAKMAMAFDILILKSKILTL